MEPNVYLEMSAALGDFVNRVGFPIAVAVFLMAFIFIVGRKMNKSTEAVASAVQAVSEAVHLQTQTIKELKTAVDDLKSLIFRRAA